MSLKLVFEPITLNGLIVPNRIVRTAHGTGFAPDGIMSDALINYHLERGNGGVGLSFLEIVAVHPSTNGRLLGYDEKIVDGYKTLIDAIDGSGMRIMQQLWHGGSQVQPLDGSPPWAPSPIVGLFSNVVPTEMSTSQIKEIVECFAISANRCEAGGVHGVEIHSAHGFLIQQFLSPLTNKREDEYGGSFENRARFLREIIKATRSEVSSSYPVGIRISPEGTRGGLTAEDCIRLNALLEADGALDFCDVSLGGFYNFPKVIGAMHEPTGYMLPDIRPVVEALNIPTIVTGRIRTLAEAEQLLKNESADMIGMTRALIADPHLIQKEKKGNTLKVRPCIGSNICARSVLEDRPLWLKCAVNPWVGRESEGGANLDATVRSAKRVLVVGGGPAGCEAATTAAQRGHEVVLCEAMPYLGGRLFYAKMTPSRHSFGDFLAWQEDALFSAGVDVRLSTYLDSTDIVEMAPDVVILATGGVDQQGAHPVLAPGLKIAGLDRDNVMTSVELLQSTKTFSGQRAVVYDETGDYEAVAMAEFLVKAGAGVAFLTRHKSFAPLIQNLLLDEPALQRLYEHDFSYYTQAIPFEVGDKELSVQFLDGRPSETLPADIVVTVRYREPAKLSDYLSDAEWAKYVVGDARAPRQLRDAIMEGSAAGMAV